MDDYVGMVYDTMLSVIDKVDDDYASFSIALILSEHFNSVGIKAELIAGYLVSIKPSGNRMYIRHVWCEVGKDIIDYSVYDFIEYKHVYSIPSCFIPVISKKLTDLETTIDRFSKGMPMKKYYSSKSIRTYNYILNTFNSLIE